MGKAEQCEQAIQKYYAEILRHCMYLFNGNRSCAEDCTQDVFFLLFRKKEQLQFDQNIRGWLYMTAEQTVRNYKKRQMRSQPMLPEELEQIVDSNSIAEDFVDFSVLAELTEEELRLLSDYYEASQGDRAAVAAQYGMTLGQLYRKVHLLRKRVKKKK